jgi:uncharacterized membrane protein
MSAPRRYAPFYFALLSSMAASVVALWLATQVTIQITANAFFIVYLALECLKLPMLTPEFLKKHAASADEPAWIIIAVALAAVTAAVGSLFVLVNRGQPNGWEIGLSLSSVALGWLTIHAMAALHYAHLYWRPEDSETEDSAQAEMHGGLEFPGGDEPGGYDFLYFSLVTGMTAQTSDVAVTKTRMRKLNLLHALVSFLFNTVLVAAAVNVAVSFNG